MTEDQKRKQAEHLVDVYLNWLQSVTHDAGWHQDSMLARAITFAGEIPEPTRNDKSNNKMVYEIGFLKPEHAKLRLAIAAIRTLNTHNPDQMVAVLASRFYTGSYFDGRRNRMRTYTDVMRALIVGQRPKAFRENAKKGIAQLVEIIRLVQIGMAIQEKCLETGNKSALQFP